MNIGFVGAGRMGSSLGTLFSQRGIEISGFYDIDTSKSDTAAVLCHTKRIDSIQELNMLSDAIFITTNDSAIESACHKIAACPFCEKKIIFHVSGLLNASVLASAENTGYHTVSLHPLQSVTGGMEGAKRLKDCLFTIEGNDSSVEAAQLMLERCGIYPKRILAEQKVAYHTAASLASNHFFSLIDTAVELLTTAGFDSDEAINAMLPLIRGSIDNLEAFGVEAAVTGPIVRGDISTTRKHLECISKALPADTDMFRKTGDKLARIARRAKLIDSDTADKIIMILEGGLK